MCARKGDEATFGGEQGTFKQKDIDKIEELGGKRWTKGDKDRIYLTNLAYTVGGLEVSRYGTNRISYATLDGEEISNSAANNAIYNSNFYIDLTTGAISSPRIENKFTIPRPQEIVPQRIYDYIIKLRESPKKK